MGLALAGIVAGIGATTILAGAGLVWAAGGVASKEAPSFGEAEARDKVNV